MAEARIKRCEAGPRRDRVTPAAASRDLHIRTEEGMTALAIQRRMPAVTAERFLRLREVFPARPVKQIKADRMALPESKREWITVQAEKHDLGERGKLINAGKRMQEILKVLDKFPNRKFDGIDLVAALSRQYGMEPGRLLPYINALRMLDEHMRCNGSSPMGVSGSRFTDVIRNDLLRKILRVLSFSEDPLKTSEVSEKIGCKKDSRSSNLYALWILEEMGHISSLLPEGTDKPGGQEYRWISARLRKSPKTLETTNGSFRLLMRLSSGKKQLAELSLAQDLFGKHFGSEDGVKTATRTRFLLDDLISRGLVTRKEIPNRKNMEGSGGGRKSCLYSLTSSGREVVDRQSNTTYLTPATKHALLSDTYKRPKPWLVRRLSRMEKVIQVRMAYERVLAGRKSLATGERAKIAKDLGVSELFVIQVNGLEILPWGKLRFETIAGVYLPALQKRNPNAAEWLKRELLREERYISRRTTRIKSKIPPTRILDRSRTRSFDEAGLLATVSKPDVGMLPFRRYDEDGGETVVMERIGSNNKATYRVRIDLIKFLLTKPTGEAHLHEIRAALQKDGKTTILHVSNSLGELEDLGVVEAVGKKYYRITDYWNKNAQSLPRSSQK
jgi:hypothetical protein